MAAAWGGEACTCKLATLLQLTLSVSRFGKRPSSPSSMSVLLCAYLRGGIVWRGDGSVMRGTGVLA